MSNGTVRAFIAVVGAVALATFGNPAHAVFVSSGFDPTLFSGVGLFEFDDACLLVDGSHSGASCHATLLSASIDVTGSGHVDFAPVLPDSADILDIVILGGALVGVDTNPIGWAFASPCSGPVCSQPWWLQWTSSPLAVLLYTGTCGTDDEEDGGDLSTHHFGKHVSSDFCTRNEGATGTATHVTFARVPEPATLGLIAVAMAMGIPWFARRRRSLS